MLSRGFTLIETLVVVSIVGILIGLSTVGLRGAQASARDTQRKTDLQDIRSALEVYRTDCGSYPASITFGQSLTGNCGGSNNTYMATIPQDPQNTQKGHTYRYANNYPSAGKYELCSFLENAPSGAVAFTCGGATNCQGNNQGCFYKVINP